MTSTPVEEVDSAAGQTPARGSLVPPVLTLTLGVAALWVSAGIPVGRLDNDPGPALLPQVAGLALVGFSLFLLWHREPHEQMPRGSAMVRVVLSIVFSFAYALAMEPLGFPTATTLFLIAQMYLVGLRKPLVLVPSALVLAVAIYALFRYGLEVPLPGVQIGGIVL